MILLVDAGNSRVKWALHDGKQWHGQGAIANAEVETLADAWRALDTPEQITVCNVAGPAMADRLAKLFSRWPVEPHWVKAATQQCGVANRYAQPAQLGADRWAALIAARQLHHGACVVVHAGTAVTIDALTQYGVFLGGLILPGLAMMRTALTQGTASVQVDKGCLSDFPTNTADAVHSGALQAVVGAVQQLALQLKQAGAAECRIILAGGDAPALHPLFNNAALLVDNLVLQGLLIMTQESSAR